MKTLILTLLMLVAPVAAQTPAPAPVLTDAQRIAELEAEKRALISLLAEKDACLTSIPCLQVKFALLQK